MGTGASVVADLGRVDMKRRDDALAGEEAERGIEGRLRQGRDRLDQFLVEGVNRRMGAVVVNRGEDRQALISRLDALGQQDSAGFNLICNHYKLDYNQYIALLSRGTRQRRGRS